MLDNVLTLPVDVLNNSTPVDVIFNRYEEYQNRSVYITLDHTLSKRDMLGFYRTPPKKSGNFRGSAKTEVKFTLDIDVPGVDSTTTLTSPAILDISFAFPVGITEATALVLRQRAIALLDYTVFMNRINMQLEV